MKRILTALILVPVITYLVLWAPAWAFTFALFVIGSYAFHEFSNIADGHGIRVNLWIGFLSGACLLVLPSTVVIAVLALAAMAFAIREPDLRQSLPSAAALLLGVVYVFGAWRCAEELRNRDHWLLFFALAMNWIGDTAAMYVGKAFGRHKMAPIVSPGKTWEGAAASAIGAAIFGFALFHYAGPPMQWWAILLLSVVGNLTGQVGDLAESAFKRGAGMKDSGSSLPGHGGWLDRIDSSLFSVPAIYALAQLLLH